MEGSTVVRELHVVSGQQESCIFSPFCGFYPFLLRGLPGAG